MTKVKVQIVGDVDDAADMALVENMRRISQVWADDVKVFSRQMVLFGAGRSFNLVGFINEVDELLRMPSLPSDGRDSLTALRNYVANLTNVTERE